jgi:hypothetical protein
MGYVCGQYEVEMNEPDDLLQLDVKDYRTLAPKPVGILPKFKHVQPGYPHPVLVPFHADLRSVPNMIAATVHRFGCAMPEREGVLMALFERVSKRFITSHFSQVDVRLVPSLATWLERYPGPRLRSLVKTWDSTRVLGRDSIVRVESFLKDEVYMKPKNPRGINSYSDESKMVLGPLMHAADKVIFKSKHYVKGTNPKEWPQKMEALFGNSRVIGTDFSSMEAHHCGVYARIVYFAFAHVLKHVPGARYVRALLKRLMLGVNEITFGPLRIRLLQRLMSGALWTSSGNGVLNLLLMGFMSALSSGCHDEDAILQFMLHKFVGLFEGDDGLCVDYGIEADLPEKMGLKLKFDKFADYSRAGFCKVYCDRGSMTTIREPIEVLAKFFLLPSKYALGDKSHLALLRAKALSYGVMYSKCPILGALIQRVLWTTSGYMVKQSHFDAVKLYHSQYEDLPKRIENAETPESARHLMSEIFGISVDEQLRIERVLNARPMDRFAPIELDLDRWVDSDMRFNALRYVAPYNEHWVRPQHDLPPIIEEFLEGTGIKAYPEEATILHKWVPLAATTNAHPDFAHR